MPTVADLRVKFSADVGGAITGIRKVDDSIRHLAAGARSALGGLDFGQMLNVAGGNIIASGIRNITSSLAFLGREAMGAINASASLSASISNIGAVSNASTADLARIKDLVNQLGIDPHLKVNATEAASAIQMLAKNGIKLPDILGGAARYTVLLANSTGADFAVAADVMSSAMAQFGMSAKDVGQAVNGITAVTTNSKLDINDYQLAIAQAGGVAASSGVEFEDFNTTIAAIAPLFGSGSDAGTSFKTFLQRLIPQSRDAASMMQQLGLMTADGTNQFFNANGELKDQAEIVGLLNRSFKGLSEEQKINAMSTIFGTDAMRAAAAMADMTEEQYRNLQKTMRQTDAEKSAAIRMDNLAGDMEIFSGTMEAMTTLVGERFQPVLRGMFQELSPIVAEIAPKLANIAGFLAQGIESAMPSLKAFNDAFIMPALNNFIDKMQHAESWSNVVLKVTGDDFSAKVAEITKLLGGEVTINAKAQIVESNIAWGLWTHTYNAKAEITEDSVLWGAWTKTYNAKAEIAEGSVGWGAYTYVYDAGAQISGTDIGWGAYTHIYDAYASIPTKESILWGLFTIERDITGKIVGAYIGNGANIPDVTTKGIIASAAPSTAFEVPSVNVTGNITGVTPPATPPAINVTGNLSVTPPTTPISVPVTPNASPSAWSTFWSGFIGPLTPIPWDKVFSFKKKGEELSFNITQINWAQVFDFGLEWNPKIPERLTWENVFSFSLSNWAPTIKWPNPPAWVSWLMGWNGSIPASASRQSAVPAKENANGTSYWRGGATWVDERGPELFHFPSGEWAFGSDKGAHLVNLPRGTEIYSHENAMRMMGGAAANFGKSDKLTWIGANADGTTNPQPQPDNVWQQAAQAMMRPPGVSPRPQTFWGQVANSLFNPQRNEKIADAITGASDTYKKASDKLSKTMDGVGKKFGEGIKDLKGALESVPGLFGTSPVTQQQMDLAALGIPQNFADDWIRRLTDEVVNGVDWAGVDIKDAAIRAGLDPSLPAKAILELVKQQWNDSSFFAGGKNTDLINQEAVQKALQRQADAASGKAALMNLFGITPEQATGQAVALGTSMRSGIEQGLTQPTAGGGSDLLGSLTEVTPEQMAPIGAGIVNGLTVEIGKTEYADKIGAAFTKLFTGFLEKKEALTDVGSQIMTRITESLGNVAGLDMVGKFASAFRAQLALPDAITTLHDVGARILELVYQGYVDAAKEKDWPKATVTTNTVNPPPATGTPQGRSALALAGAGAGGPTVNVYATVASGVDIHQVAYQVADIIQKRSRR